MGIRATDFEQSALGTASSSVAGSYHERNSVASGLQAHATAIQAEAQANKAMAGILGSCAEVAKAIGDNCNKAYAMRGKNIAAVANNKKAFDAAKSKYDAAVADKSGKFSAEDIAGFKSEMDGCRDAYNGSVTKLHYGQFWTGQMPSAFSGEGKMNPDGSIVGTTDKDGNKVKKMW